MSRRREQALSPEVRRERLCRFWENTILDTVTSDLECAGMFDHADAGLAFMVGDWIADAVKEKDVDMFTAEDASVIARYIKERLLRKTYF